MNAVRQPAVAGMFYPADHAELRAAVEQHIDRASRARVAASGARGHEQQANSLRAVIAPHAGYIYSGPTAGHAYARIEAEAERFTRVLLLGPTHRVAVDGLALPGAEAMRTPLGDVEIDPGLARQAATLPHVVTSAAVHAQEHSLEVHLPFLQVVLPGRPVLPLAVGRASAEQVADVIEALYSDNTLVVVSSDLSHYLPQSEAVATDVATLDQVLALDPTIGHRQACGATPMIGLLTVARRRGWVPALLDRTTSADTAGTPDRVVGYASVEFTSAPENAGAQPNPSRRLSDEEALAHLPALARAAIEHHLDGTATGGGARGDEKEGGLRAWWNRRREREDEVDDYRRTRDAARGHASTGTDAGLGAHPALTRTGASFVTLTRPDGSLRGCIGSLVAELPLVEDVEQRAVAAATRDPRFAPVTRDELDELHIEVSVLSAPEPLTSGADSTEAEALAMLRPGVDGVILQAGGRRATFLPQVWHTLPDPVEFLGRLRLKAGLPRDYWGPDVQLQRYTATEYHEGAGESPSESMHSEGGAQ